jgi:hypothetical protein
MTGLIISIVLLLDQTFTPEQSRELPWWQIVTGIIAIPASIIGLLSAYRVSEKTRYETRKLQLEILEKEGIAKPESKKNHAIPRKDLVTSPLALAASVQGFIIRFIIFYIAYEFWGLIISFILPTFWLVINLARDQGLSYTKYQVFALAGNYMALMGNLTILLILGFPLLRDIMSFLGLKPRDLLRFRRSKG